MIDSFSGEHRFLSNFYPCTIRLGGADYPSTEHAFQAAKTLDPDERLYIETLCATPAEAKRAGRRVKMRADWNAIRDDVMLACLRQKFSREPLRSKLLTTGDQPLVEGNHWGDTYWGVCRGKGENRLGELLMQVREELTA